MASRVPIPRLLNQEIKRKPGRTSRACDECRSRKAKCDGEKPTCSNCKKLEVTCRYSDPKRKVEQTELEMARKKTKDLENVLHDILHEVDSPVAKKIERVLKPPTSTRGSDSASKVAPSSLSSSSSSSVGSVDAMDTLDEDLNQTKNSRATGYLGKSSEVSWMRSLEMQSGGSSGNENYLGTRGKSPSPNAPPTASMNYHIEPSDYPAEEVENIYALPERIPAERLLRIYMESVQPSLPVLRTDLFTDQFDIFYSGNSSHPGRKWLALLNLVFAISTRLCQISGQDTQNMGHQFFSRAQMLNISESIVEDHEDLQQVQLEALAAFYLLTSSHVNRAWKMIGVATRSSISLGLHLQATHNFLNREALEARNKLFWSIFSLENLLSDMTGRTSCLWTSYCSAPPPLASPDMSLSTNATQNSNPDQGSPSNLSLSWTIDQDQKQLKSQRELLKQLEATSELYFFSLIDLTVISHTASARVYNKEALSLGWDEIKNRIDLYNGIMLEWRVNLPDSLKFDTSASISNPNLSINDAYRVSLALKFHSSRIILNRPCLTRKKSGENDKPHLSRTRKDIEMTCLQSALAIISIFPDEPSAIWFRNIIWWSILHFLVQSIVILLISISCNTSPSNSDRDRESERDIKRELKSPLSIARSSNGSPTQSEAQVEFKTTPFNPTNISLAIEKALRWLHHLGKSDKSARRAFNLCNTCIHRIKSNNPQLTTLETMNFPSESSHLEVPTDSDHQQSRSKNNVPHTQFAGTRGFGFDGKLEQNGGDSLPGTTIGGLDGFGVVEPSICALAVDTDMSDYILDPETTTLDDILQCLA